MEEPLFDEDVSAVEGIHWEAENPFPDNTPDNIIDGIVYPDDPFETIEELRKELGSLRRIITLLKGMD